jgi:hypothetical protein
VSEQTCTGTGTENQSYEENERQDLRRRILDFRVRFGYNPDPDQDQAVPAVKRPAPEASSLTPSDLATMEQRLLDTFNGMERRILDVLSNRKPPKPETQSPFIRRKEAVKLLGCRSTLEKCEKAGWLTATTRRARLVLYKRQDVMACVYRISQGEYP